MWNAAKAFQSCRSQSNLQHIFLIAKLASTQPRTDVKTFLEGIQPNPDPVHEQLCTPSLGNTEPGRDARGGELSPGAADCRATELCPGAADCRATYVWSTMFNQSNCT